MNFLGRSYIKILTLLESGKGPEKLSDLENKRLGLGRREKAVKESAERKMAARIRRRRDIRGEMRDLQRKFVRVILGAERGS